MTARRHLLAWGWTRAYQLRRINGSASYRRYVPARGRARPYPVWPEPGWPLGKDQELDEALAQLELALTGCDVALEYNRRAHEPGRQQRPAFSAV